MMTSRSEATRKTLPKVQFSSSNRVLAMKEF